MQNGGEQRTAAGDWLKAEYEKAVKNRKAEQERIIHGNWLTIHYDNGYSVALCNDAETYTSTFVGNVNCNECLAIIAEDNENSDIIEFQSMDELKEE